MWVEHIFKAYNIYASTYLNLDEAFLLGLSDKKALLHSL